MRGAVTRSMAAMAAVMLSVGPAAAQDAPRVAALDAAQAALTAVDRLQRALDTRVMSGNCEEAIRHAAAAYGVPVTLALALGRAESGGHPWAVNAALTGRRFASKGEAVRYVEEERRQGVATIDVGCLQVSLYWHAEAFATLEEAFDPSRNAAAGIARLAALRRETASWTEAIARYHGASAAADTAHYVCRVTNEYRALMKRPALECAAGATAQASLADLGPDAATRARIQRAQSRLADLGYDVGRADGAIGPATARALAAFQRSRGLAATGRLSVATAAALGLGEGAQEVANREMGR